MPNERETRKSRDLWGNEREEVYENGRKVGEIKSESRGGLLGLGGEQVRVEYDTNGNERTFTREENRGGILGIGAELTEVRHDSSGEEIGSSRVEERGGLLGIGAHHVRVERDTSGNEVSQSNHERRGNFLGMGGARVRITRFSEDLSARAHGLRDASSKTSSGSSYRAESSSDSIGPFSIIFLILAAGLTWIGLLVWSFNSIQVVAAWSGLWWLNVIILFTGLPLLVAVGYLAFWLFVAVTCITIVVVVGGLIIDIISKS